MTEPDAVEPLTADNLSAFDAAPQIGGAGNAWVMPLGVAGAVALGLLVFGLLSAGRTRSEAAGISSAHAETRTAVQVSQRPATTSPAPAPPTSPAIAAVPTTPPGPPAPDPNVRHQAPALIVDLSQASQVGDNAQGRMPNVPGGDVLSNDERFAARLGVAGQSARARALDNPKSTIPQGELIAAVLETAINSDLPGYARALVSRDVSSFDGSRVLIPRGSRLIGQYRSGVALGQSRAFVIWTRLIRPDGATIDLNSPGIDALGRGGLEGETDNHFLGRFGGAILMTLLGAAANAAATDNNADTQVIVGVAQGGGDAASVALHDQANVSPTIRVAQGTPIRIFVARDLDFSSTGPAP